MISPRHFWPHVPCLDGVNSNVLFKDFCENVWGERDFVFHAPDYDRRQNWLATDLGEKNAVLDFLYHPRAEIWIDHHPSAFITEAARCHYESRQNQNGLVFEPRAKSCTEVVADYLEREYGYRNSRLEPLIGGARQYDTVDYASPHEAIFGTTPFIVIGSALAFGLCAQGEDLASLIGDLQTGDVAGTAERPQVRAAYAKYDRQRLRTLERIQKTSRLSDDGMIFFDITAKQTSASRFGGFYFHPDARYVAAIVRDGNAVDVRVGENPWNKTHGPDLGKIAKSLGGGGHEAIGVITLTGDDRAGAAALLQKFLAALRAGQNGN